MNLDVVIVSDAKDNRLRNFTEQAIRSCLQNESKAKLNIYVIETQAIEYSDVTATIHPSEVIAYNKFLNIGAKAGNADYIAFCNNDLLFGKDWASALLEAMDLFESKSACPYCPTSHQVDRSLIKINSGVYAGYTIRQYFAGWCFVLTRELWNRIGGLDERLTFWCCDNSTAEQIKMQNERHILVTNSIVTHLGNGSHTLNDLPPAERQKLMHPEVRKFNRLYNQNLFGLGRG
jgi:hypothetical protein